MAVENDREKNIKRLRKLLGRDEGVVIVFWTLSEEEKNVLMRELMNIVKDTNERNKVRENALFFVEEGISSGVGLDIIKDDDIKFIENILEGKEKGSSKLKNFAFLTLLELMKKGIVTDAVIKGFVRACMDEEISEENRSTALRVVRKWIDEGRELKGISDSDIQYILCL